MYRISELADLVGLSRTTLLYYEKLGLIHGQREDNGYRSYTEMDVQRVRLIQKLKDGGLRLKECRACLESKVDRQLLVERLRQLDREIEQKQKSRQLLAGLLGEASLNEWHMSLNEIAPDAHLDWLRKQGFSEKEALHLKWLSKDMNEHEKYMADFMKIFEPLERWGPGSIEDTLRALSLLPKAPKNILEIGSGKGISTLILAQHTDASITAVDNEPLAITGLQEQVDDHGLPSRVHPVCASMTELPFEDAAFDLIWAEASAYIMGVENALVDWKRFLQDKGFLVISDLVWLTDQPSEESAKFWKSEYPDMQSIATRVRQMQAAGYEVIDQFALSLDSWNNYTDPLQARVMELQPEMQQSAAIKDISTELEIYRHYLGNEFGYHFFILRKES